MFERKKKRKTQIVYRNKQTNKNYQWKSKQQEYRIKFMLTCITIVYIKRQMLE